jgi:hypothetical protein
MIHLTKRSVEFLKALPNKVDYKSEPALAACGHRKANEDDWCRVEDVRAILRKEVIVTINSHHRKQGKAWIRDVQIPTCPVCAVMLDKLLSEKT